MNMKQTWIAAALLMIVGISPAAASAAQLNDSCSASANNQTIPVNADGTFAIPNVSTFGTLFRVRVTCPGAAGTLAGHTEFRLPVANGSTNFTQPIVLGVVDPIPEELELEVNPSTLAQPGQTVQVTVTALLPDQSEQDVTTAPGTAYITTNPAIATVDGAGVVTAVSSGTVLVAATVEGVIGSVSLTVALNVDSDSDGLPDDFEIANGLNPNNPADAGFDPDNDGLTNLQEFQNGSSLTIADTDGDGLTDGEDVSRGLSPIDPDSDDDGVLDGAEVAFGSDPLDADSDNDGLPDGVEVRILGNPLNASPNGDADFDQLSNLDEVLLGTDPLDPDTDNDTVFDGVEVQLGCNPVAPDPSTITGRTVDRDAQSVANAAVQILGLTNQSPAGTTNGNGVFTIPGVLSCRAAVVRASAEVVQGGQTLNGLSAPMPLVNNGITDVGTFLLTGAEETGLYPAQRLLAGNSPTDVAAGDLNKDGLLDLVTANEGSNDLSIFYGRGRLLFTEEQRLAAGSIPSAVSIADVDADSNLDILVANAGSDTVGVYAGDGTGNFDAPILLPVGDAPVALVVADLDADRTLDLATVNIGGTLSVYTDSLTVRHTEIVIGTQPRTLAVGDVNRDGHVDLLTAKVIFPNALTVLLGDSTGDFPAQVDFSVGGAPVSIAVGDVNGDNRVDVVTANQNTYDLSVFLAVAQGPGIFEPEQRVPLIPGPNPDTVVLADVNHDEHLDALVANHGAISNIGKLGELSVVLGNGDGTFGPVRSVATGNGPDGLVVRDFDGDNQLDAVIPMSPSHTVAVLGGTGDGGFYGAKRIGLNFSTAPGFVVAADVNEDGQDDIATENSINTVLFLSQPDGGYDDIPLFEGAPAGGVAFGDLDGDNHLDAVGSTGNTLTVQRGNGDGTFQPLVQLDISSIAPLFELAIGLIDGDNLPDVVALIADPQLLLHVAVFKGLGGGALTSLFRFGLVQGAVKDLVLKEVTGDNFLDLVLSRDFANGNSKTISVIPGLGDGTFTGEQTYDVDSGIRGLEVADVNEDSFADIITGGSTRVSVLLNPGNGVFGVPVRISAGHGPNGVTVTDANQDGHQDIVVADFISEDVAVLFGNGNGTFTEEQRFVSSGLTFGVVAGNFCGTAAPDLALTTYGAFGRNAELNILCHLETDIAGVAPTVDIIEPTANDTAIEGANLYIEAMATDDVAVRKVSLLVNGALISVQTHPTYGLDFPVPSGITELTISAVAEDYGGNVSQVSQVTVPVVPPPADQPPTVAILEPDEGTSLIEGTQVTVRVFADDDVGIQFVRFTIEDGENSRADFTFPYEATFTVPGLAEFDLVVTATDTAGQSTQVSRFLPIVADPRTTVIGTVVDGAGAPVTDAEVVFDNCPQATTSGLDGAFSVPGCPTVNGDIAAFVNITIGPIFYFGQSAPTAPVVGGTTDVGQIVLQPQ